MTEDHSTRRSIYEDIEKLGEKSERRRSFFEKPHLTTQEQAETDAVLKEWDRRWGKYNLDYVNIVKYPDDYVQKIKEEKEMWMKGVENIEKRAKMIYEEEESGSDLIITEDILTTEQKASLRVIDSNINEFIKKSITFLKEFEVYKRMQEVKLEKIERERQMIEKMAVANK